MAYSICLHQAAKRHFLAAEYFYSNSMHLDIAGYLYGISAECAVKEILNKSNVKFSIKGRNKENPLYAHFPVIKKLLRNYIQGRNTQVLRIVIEDNFLQEWDVTMRYAPYKNITKKMVDRWREQSRAIFNIMSGY